MKKKAIVIGAGIGGMASAIRLANLGFETIVYESNSFPGGKINSKKISLYRFDMGPSIFTEPELIDELLSISNKEKSDFEYSKLKVSCNYFFVDGVKLSLPVGEQKVAQVLEKELGEDGKSVLKYLKTLRKNYEAVYPVFVASSLHRVSQWLNTSVFRAIARIPRYGLFKTMHEVNQKQFNNKKTVQIFNRFATYNGSDPYQSPAMLNIIAHLELNIGSCFPKGGMVSISKHVYEHACSMGVLFHFNQRVEQINYNDKRVTGVSVGNEFHEADIVISNMDIHNTYEKLLINIKGPQKILKQEKSTSALVFYWGIKKKFPELDVHNIFFAENYEEEFKSLFEDKVINEDPTVYIHVSSKIESDDAPEYGENWFVMVNAPINTGQNWEEIREQTRKNIVQKLNRTLKQNIEDLIEVEDYIDPVKMEAMYSGRQGSIYGNSSNSKMAAFHRHPNFSSQVKGLYFAGVTVHPGGGIPLALNSAKIIEKCIREDLNMN